MLPDHETLYLALGIIFGMAYYQRTGLACGGIITPGFVAMYLGSPVQLGIAFGSGVATFLLLTVVVRYTGLYGRQRLAGAMLIALFLKVPLSQMGLEPSLWLGWVVPGLIGADIQKQGILPTIWGTISTGIAAAMGAQLLLPLLF